MLLLATLLLFVTTFALISAYGYRRIVKPASILDQVARSTAPATNVVAGFEETPAVGFAKFLASIGSLLPSSAQEAKLSKKELTAAGVRYAHAVPMLTGIKLLSCAALALAALLFRDAVSSSPLTRLLLPVMAGIAGYLAPSLVLARMIKKRRMRIRLALPDVLDLLVISTEAGCALDKAVLNVSREFRTFHPEISEELALVNAEMLAGNSRIEALRNFANRTGEEELSKLVAILVQTDRFGTSVSEALRTQSEFMRVQRRQTAEEKAGKVGVKLVFPIFFFCMPALLVLVAGPGLIQILKILPSLGNM